MGAVVAGTVCMLRECEGARLTAILVWGWMRCGCGECRACWWYTCSGIVSSAADVLWMSVLRGMRGVDGVCEMCMCLARSVMGGEGGQWMIGLGLGFTNSVGTGGVLDVYLCLGCGGVGWEWVGGLDHGMLLLFAFQFISIWVSRLEIAEFPDSFRRSAPYV